MSAVNTLITLVVVLNCPRSVKEFITYARGVLVALQNNISFPSPPLSLDVFAMDIGALEEAETKAATRAKGAAAFRDAKLAKVKDDLARRRGPPFPRRGRPGPSSRAFRRRARIPSGTARPRARASRITHRS